MKHDNQRLYNLKITLIDDYNNNWPVVRQQETTEVGQSIKVEATDLDRGSNFNNNNFLANNLHRQYENIITHLFYIFK